MNEIIDTTATEREPETGELAAVASMPNPATLIEGTALKPKPPNGAPKKPKAEKTDADIADELGARAGGGGGSDMTRPLKELRIAEDANIREIIEALGSSGAFKIGVSRVDPQEVRDPQTGRLVKCGGHLKSYDHAIDEEFIASRHGGGKYALRFHRKGRTGNFVIVTERRIEVAGEPNLDELRSSVGPMQQQPQPQSAEAPSVVTKAMEMMERHMDKERAPAVQQIDIKAITAPLESMIAQLTTQMRDRDTAHDRLVSEMRADLAAARAFKPPEDPLKEKLLGSLIDGESGRITGLRLQQESEVRVLKQNAIEDEKRLRDSFERDKVMMIAAFDRERQTMLHSHEIALASTKTSFDTQVKVLEGQIKQIERDNTELRVEVKELRAKKDKSLVEQAKDIQAVKDALGLDEATEKSAFDTIAEVVTDPNAAGFVKSFFKKDGGAPAPQQAPQQAQAPAGPPPGGYQRQIVTTPDGQRWIMEADGRLTGPVKKKGQSGTNAPEMPVIPQEVVDRAVHLLERAFEGGADPETVATSAKAMVPAEIMQVLRDHGPDAFMTKVAKVPMSSPLSSQEARNWFRKVCKAAVG